ncbi:MAG: methyl-accepting chemotaxis protein [Candidatus Anstonellales archaeon]
MKNFHKSIRVKSLLWVMEILFVLSFVVLGITNIIHIEELNKNTSDLYNKNIQSMEKISDIKSAFLEMRLNANKQIRFYELGEYRQEFSDNVKSKYREILTTTAELERIKGLTEMEKANISSIKDDLKKYITLYENLDKTMKEKRSLPDLKEFDTIAETINGKSNNLVSLTKSDAFGKYEQSKQTANSTKNNFIAISISLLVLISIMFFTIAKIIFINMRNLNKVIAELERYNFTIDIDTEGRNEFIEMSKHLDKMKKSIRGLIATIQEKSTELNGTSQELYAISTEMTNSSEEVSNTIEQVAMGASNQANELQIIISSLEELNTSIQDIYSELAIVINKSEQTIESSIEGKNVLEELKKSKKEVVEKFTRVNETILGLTEAVNNITMITNTINEIAEQTNLLALNAAIEAARAGEAGRGFNVVAIEIRKLAEHSRNSVKEIHDIIDNITNRNMHVIEELTNTQEELDKQEEIMNTTTQAFTRIENSSKEMTEPIMSTRRKLDIMADIKNKITANIESVGGISEENTALAEEVTATSEQLYSSAEEVLKSSQVLSNLSEELQQSINKFRI